jgi:peptidyl-prolyl cis-trans isomerase B (cyclophilin B)
MRPYGKPLLIGLAIVLVLAVGIYAWIARAPEPPGAGNDRTSQVGDEAEKREEAMKITAPTEQEINQAKAAGKIPVTIETARGIITLELRGDLMPLTVANFTKLARAGFYDGLRFHRVEDWVIQGGDPKGDGTGGPGYAIKLETHPQMKNVRGAIAMARARDPNSAGSQFYILRTDAPWLDGDYAVFGHVQSGLVVVDEIERDDQIVKVTVGQ